MNKLSRDRLAGLVIALVGLGAAVESWGYGTGTLLEMGPGFFPFALGCLLAFLGLLVAGVAVPGAPAEHKAEWRGWGCILTGMLAFLGLGHLTGLVPATFACVLVSAMGDRSITWREALVLAAGVTLFGAIVFSYFLGIPMQLFRWGAA